MKSPYYRETPILNWILNYFFKASLAVMYIFLLLFITIIIRCIYDTLIGGGHFDINNLSPDLADIMIETFSNYNSAVFPVVLNLLGGVVKLGIFSSSAAVPTTEMIFQALLSASITSFILVPVLAFANESFENINKRFKTFKIAILITDGLMYAFVVSGSLMSVSIIINEILNEVFNNTPYILRFALYLAIPLIIYFIVYLFIPKTKGNTVLQTFIMLCKNFLVGLLMSILGMTVVGCLNLCRNLMYADTMDIVFVLTVLVLSLAGLVFAAKLNKSNN